MRLLLTTLLIAASSAFAQSTQPAQTFRDSPSESHYRPLVPDMVADPSIAEFDGTFYMYATTDGYGRGLETSGPAVVWKSKDFVNWSFDGEIIPNLGPRGARYWAPSAAIKRGGDYFLYPTVELNIYAYKSKSPEGPFVKASDILVPLEAPNRTKGIDADILVDDDGSAYMVWAQRGISRLSPDMTSLVGEPAVISTKRRGYSEGPILFKRNGIYYYLYTLDGHENYTYAYVMSRTSPMGPYEFPEKDIIAVTNRKTGIYGPGHGNVFVRPNGDAYFVYLEFGRGGTTRQVYANKLEFNPDGTLQPVQLTPQGVGALAPSALPPRLQSDVVPTASSSLPPVKIKPINDKSLDRVESFSPVNALDSSNATRWMADESDATPSLTLDLTKPVTITRSDLFFVRPTAGTTWKMEASDDGISWKEVGGNTDPKVLRSPHTVNFATPLTTRYLRVTILSGQKGIWEWKLY